MLSWLFQAEESGIKETFLLKKKKKREERGPLLIKKQCSKGRPKVETGGMFGMNKLPLSFVWWHWQIELRVWKGDLSLMGNEFKVMEMNVLFEVQRALTEVILSHSNKWKQRCHMVPSPRPDSSEGESVMSL